MLPTVVSFRGIQRSLDSYPLPLDLESEFPGDGAWEVELGFGKGRYLLSAAQERPDRRFLGIEIAAKYFRMARDRAQKRGLENIVLIRGEALYLMAAALPEGFADCVHVYFPDPWPKSRHQKRRLFDPESLDLVLGLLREGGRLCFATDFLDYGEDVAAMLETHPVMDVQRRHEPWPDGARTNYEAKYLREGRAILRLEARLGSHRHEQLVHPLGRDAILCAVPQSSTEAADEVTVEAVSEGVDR